MNKFYTKVFRFLLIIPLLLISISNAHAALSKGDLAVIGMNGDADPSTTIRSFAVVALNTINTGELIYLTDRGWVNAYGSVLGHFVASGTTVEGTFQWQPSQNIPAGTIIIFKIDLASRTVSGTTGNGTSLPAADLLSILPNTWTNATLSANPWNPATGDQIMIYQGSDSNPSFIFAFNNLKLGATNVPNGWYVNNTGNEPGGQLPAYSELPSDLGTTYSTAFFTSTTNSRYPNEKYNPSFSTGTKATFLADITNTNNWTNKTSGGTPYDFSAGFGTNNTKQFNFSNSTAPTVTALSPTSGPTSGGTSVTITGTDFSGATAVTFGATAATDFTVNSATQITATAPAGTGTVDVRITTTGGTSATSASDQFTYVAAPTVTALSPTSGPTGGGTSVTITGTNFSGTTAVTFGATAATGFTVNSATQITATAPAGTGTVDVRITTTGGTSATSASDQFTYIAAPTVTALSPTSGPTSGGTSVTITGTNFSGATAVTFGATAATGFTVNSATQITATAPAGTGTVDVRVTTTGGTSATSASDQFTYVARPTVTALSPTSGPTGGGTSVTITGTNFSGTTAVTFGATAATGFTVNSATQITATAPAGTGTVDVRITTTGGTSATSASDQFTYVARPTVTALSPTSGPTGGGTSVTITGTNFSGTTAVTFGATAATGFTVNSATQITATAPAGTGTVDVRVTTTGGTSATSASDQFTYVTAPTVTALSPTSGPTGGGTSVTITGNNFSGTTAVTFGATAATGFTVNSATQITATAPAGTGTVDVRVTTTGGTSATSASDQFTYIARPTVTALSPTSGPTGGGTSVTITGTNFSGTTAVTFGATAATGFTVNSATQITATAPAGTGTVDVRVTTTGGTSATSASDQFTYVTAPTVTALSPTSGPTGGGTSVTITGTNFSGATAVTFGATAATGFTVNSATQITATAPAGTGTVDVRITTTGGTSATSASDQFTYIARPTVTALSPTSGPTGGGTSVTITGTNFSGTTAVTFGATAATGFTVNSATQITATAPAGTGTVDVRITTTGGTSATSASDQFTYVARPTVTALSPTSGPTGGGTSVTITGTNFSGTTAVTFGATAATGFTVNSATQITATAPAGTGTVDVRITTTGGTSATSASDQFTYVARPTVTALSPTSGPTGGGTSVTITGTNFSGTTAVTFGATAATGFTVNSATQITATAPAGTGTVDVRITTTGGTSATSASDQFTYALPSQITASSGTFPSALSTTYGTASASTSVTVSGTGLTAGITATPSSTANFEVSADGTNFGTSAIIGTSGTVSGTVYVRLTATAAANTNITGNITLTSTDTNSPVISIPTSTVAQRVITITAEAKSKTYGDADPALTYTFAPALAGTDTFTGSLTRLPGENGGTYAINQGTLALNSNYTLTYIGAILSINAKTVTVTAAAKSKTYGDADPALTYTFAPVLVGTDTFTGSLTRVPGENVGTYAINQGTLALNSNYTLTYVVADLTIGAKTVTVTAAAKSKTYGDADPALTYTFVPVLVGTDTFTGSLTRAPGENVGTYAINQGTLALNSNYTLTYVGADLTIGAKTVTVTAAAKSKTYGDADPALTYTFAPVLTGTDTFTGSLTRVPGENMGTYAINQGTLALNGNYTLTYISADLTIGAKTVAVTAAAKSKTYGDADPALTYTFAPALVGTDTFTGSLTRLPGENVGTYAINQGTLALNSNYTLTYVGADLTIGAKTVTVNAAAKSKTYGDADPALTYTFAPVLVGTDTFTGSLTRLPGENIGTYAINQGTLALNGNYTLTYISADLTIGAKTVAVTAAAKSKTYGDADPALTYTFAPALVGTDTFTGSLTRLPGENVGTYAINQGTLALNSNYTLTYVGADLTIGAKTVTVNAAAKSKTYGDADPALTYTFAPVLVGTDTFTGSLTRLPGENIGTYAINQGTLALNSNYTLTYVGADLTIGAKTVAVSAVAKSKTYGDADPALTYTFAPVLVGTDTFTGSLTRLPGENIGTYAINQGTLALNSNYTLTYLGANLTIGNKTVTVTAAAKSKTYGDADPALTYTFAPALVSGDSFSGNLARANGNNVGNYAISQGTLALNSNYTLTYVGADLTIGAKTVAVTAVAKSKTYGDADPALTYDFAPVLVSGDTFSGGLSRTAGQNVGNYAINQGTLALNSNYTLTYVSADFTIGKKTITITAAAKSKTYGDADPALTYDFAPALVSGDTFSGSLSRLPGQNVGTYAINQSTLALNSNYTLTYVGANFIIGKKTITVTAAAKSKTYGDADPALTYDFTPVLVSGDSFSGSLTRLPGQNVGTYAINQGTLALNSNYTLTYIGANLTIGKKTIMVTAAAKSKTYGDADPALTYDFAPALVSGDTFSGSLTRLPGQNVGTYAINQGTLALNSNYTLTYVGANLTIGKKTVTVTAAAKSKTYGDADPALTYTFAPALVTGDTFSGNLARANGNNVGTYAINQGTLALNSNYTLTYVSNNFVITAKPITVTANASQSKVYGTADPVYTYSVSPALVSGDSFTGALGRVAGNDAGVYAITQGTLNAGTNYNLTYVGNNFTIVKANQTITWNQTLGFGCEGETTVILTATSSSGLPVSYTSSNNNLVSISGNSLSLLNYGSVTISANQLGNNNYNPAVVVSLPLVNSQPNLIRKQFENIIFFDNSSKSFSTYTWYKNGVLVPGQTDQYFKENGPLNGTYYAVATKLDGIAVTTCPLVLSPTVEDEYIKIVPNPVKPNASYELLNNVPTARLQNARIEVYSVGGLLLENKTTSQNTVTLKAPTVEGIYIIKMTLANGKYFTKNLLVKN